jgi:hypothetical protein
MPMIQPATRLVIALVTPKATMKVSPAVWAVSPNSRSGQQVVDSRYPDYMARRLRKPEPPEDAGSEQELREKVEAAVDDLSRRVAAGRPYEDATPPEKLVEGWKRRRRA